LITSAPTKKNVFLKRRLSVENFFPFPPILNGLVANLLLFYSDDSMLRHLIERQRVEHLLAEAKQLMGPRLQNFSGVIIVSAKLDRLSNGTPHIRHQCRKTAVLSTHKFLINSGVEKMNSI
jgi:hypothetical protein